MKKEEIRERLINVAASLSPVAGGYGPLASIQAHAEAALQEVHALIAALEAPDYKRPSRRRPAAKEEDARATSEIPTEPA